MKIKLLFYSIYICLPFFVFGQENTEKKEKIELNEIVIPDSLAYTKNTVGPVSFRRKGKVTKKILSEGAEK